MFTIWRILPRLVVLLGVLARFALQVPSWHAAAEGLTPLTTTQAYQAPPVLASAAALLDADSGRWLALRNADRELPIASTTKIMTAVLAIEHGDLNQLVTASHAAATVGESTMGLQEGERLSVHDLLYGLMLPSGNDAAIALAEHVGGSVDAFVRMMNAKAAVLHLRHTYFASPNGLDDTGYSSAHDLALLAGYAMRKAVFRSVVGTGHYTIPATAHNGVHNLTTVNYFLNWYPGAIGVKPGWTEAAGICQVVEASRYGRHLIAVVLHTPDLYTDVRDLLNFGFGDFSWKDSGLNGDTIDHTVQGGLPLDSYRYFPYTGHGIRAAFLDYFLRHGGLAAFGFPETDEIQVDGQIEQFFAGQVLSYNPASKSVTPLRLGLAAVPTAELLARVPRRAVSSWQTYFPETGHTIAAGFRQFFLAHGGTDTFGYPVTESLVSGGTAVQYFESGEFIWHDSPADGYVEVAPLGLRRLYQLHLLPLQLPPPKPAMVAG